MRIVPFEIEHYEAMKLRNTDLQTIMALPNVDDLVMLCIKGGIAYAGIVDNEVMGAAGILELWPGVGEAWVLTTPLVEKYPLFFHKNIKEYLERAFESGYHRIQCAVLSDFEVSHRWVKRLGFEYEGTMRKYGPNGEDYIRYARCI